MCQIGKNYPVVFPIGTDARAKVGKNYRVRWGEKFASGFDTAKKSARTGGVPTLKLVIQFLSG